MPRNESKILIINDDKLVCLVTGQLIKQFDAAATIAIKPDGKSALKYLCEVLSDNKVKKPDIILLDLSMPIMDGIAFLNGFAQLGKNQKEISVYILTSTVDPQVKKLAAYYPFVKDVFELPLQKEKLSRIYALEFAKKISNKNAEAINKIKNKPENYQSGNMQKTTQQSVETNYIS